MCRKVKIIVVSLVKYDKKTAMRIQFVLFRDKLAKCHHGTLCT